MRPLGLIVLGLALGACADDTTPREGELPEDLKGDNGAPTFVAIRADQPFTASERSRLVAALKSLKTTSSKGSATRQKALAAQTLQRVQAGDVRIGSLASARGADLWHMCKDLDADVKSACAGLPPSDPEWAGDAALRAAVVSELDGYMWGNRLYLTLGPETETSHLAATLVHEVNHVLNRSECWYYSDYFAHVVEPSFAWLEEYRAFVSECVLKRGSGATAARCDSYATGELEAREYGLTPDLAFILGDASRGSLPVAESLFVDDGTYGFLAPDAARWPDDFSECQSP